MKIEWSKRKYCNEYIGAEGNNIFKNMEILDNTPLVTLFITTTYVVSNFHRRRKYHVFVAPIQQ